MPDFAVHPIGVVRSSLTNRTGAPRQPDEGAPPASVHVDPEWQGAGLGTALHTLMVGYAREHGAQGLTADVLAGNYAMLRVFQRGEHAFASEADAGVGEVTMRL